MKVICCKRDDFSRGEKCINETMRDMHTWIQTKKKKLMIAMKNTARTCGMREISA